MRNIAARSGTPVVTAALHLSAQTFLRPGELRQADWKDVDLENGEWLIPVANRKLKTVQKRTAKPHWVPLSSQAVASLRDLQPLTGHRRFAFHRTATTRSPSQNIVATPLFEMDDYSLAFFNSVQQVGSGQP